MHLKVKKKFKNQNLSLWTMLYGFGSARKGVSGPIVKEKTMKLYEKLEGGGALEQFNASKGWLHRWKLRHGVRHVIIVREKLSADGNAAQDFVKKFERLVIERDLVPDQVYNVDKTGLNHKMLPKSTLAARNETVLGTKLAKNRLTIATCSNASGSHKLPLFVIGKS